jgi:hypothetical protein
VTDDRSTGRHSDFLILTLAMSAAVFTGFGFTYFGPVLSGTYQKVSPLVHLHGWSFFAWYLLLPFQAGLIRTRRVGVHRTIGGLSLVLAAVMVVTGLIVVGVRMRDALASPEPSFWSANGPGVFATLVLFTAFYAAALLNRRHAPLHKRLIIVASAAGMGAAVFRILMVAFGFLPWITLAGIVVTNLFIIAGMLLDLFREGRVHRAYLVGLPVCVAVELGILLGTPTPAGQLLARALAWVGSTLGFLY